MSGRPVRRRVLRDIRDAGGWVAVLERIANGETVTSIARSFNVSRSFFAWLLHEDRERHELVSEARRVAADALALEIVDRADAFQQAKMRADFRLRLASKLDRDQYGHQTPSAQVESNLGQLHLDALRQLAAEREQLARATATPPPAAPGGGGPSTEIESVREPWATDASRAAGREARARD